MPACNTLSFTKIMVSKRLGDNGVYSILNVWQLFFKKLSSYLLGLVVLKVLSIILSMLKSLTKMCFSKMFVQVPRS